MDEHRYWSKYFITGDTATFHFNLLKNQVSYSKQVVKVGFLMGVIFISNFDSVLNLSVQISWHYW